MGKCSLKTQLESQSNKWCCMTTIAVNKNTLTMASDRRTNDRCLRGEVTKIRYIVTDYNGEHRQHTLPTRKEVIVGSAGMLDTSEAFYYWVRKGMDVSNHPSCVPTKDFQALVLTTIAGKPIVYEVEDSWIPYEIEENFYAIGTGNMAAVAAMLCGKNVKEAVEIACMVDVWSGGGVDSYTLRT